MLVQCDSVASRRVELYVTVISATCSIQVLYKNGTVLWLKSQRTWYSNLFVSRDLVVVQLRHRRTIDRSAPRHSTLSYLEISISCASLDDGSRNQPWYNTPYSRTSTPSYVECRLSVRLYEWYTQTTNTRHPKTDICLSHVCFRQKQIVSRVVDRILLCKFQLSWQHHILQDKLCSLFLT